MDPSEKENLMQLILSATALVLLVVLAFSGLTPAAESKVNVETLVQDNSTFAIDLYRKLSTGRREYLPFSLQRVKCPGNDIRRSTRQHSKANGERPEIFAGPERTYPCVRDAPF